MYQLIKKILFLLIAIYLLNIVIALGLDQIYENSYSNFVGSNLNYYLKTQKSDTLIVGSSCSLHHIDPKDFGENSYNLSQQGMHLGYHTAVIDILYHSNKLPSKLLLLHVEAGDIYMSQEKEIIDNIRRLNYYYDKNTFIRNNINSISSSEYLKYYFTSYRHNKNATKLIANFLKNDKNTPKNKGFIPLTPTNLDSVRIDFTQEKNNKLMKQKINPKAIQFITHIQSICKRKKIKLIIFSAPYYNNYKKLIQGSLDLEKILKRKNIDYINYINNDKLPIKKRIYWYDNYHLNSRGAKIFSKIVADDVSKIH